MKAFLFCISMILCISVSSFVQASDVVLTKFWGKAPIGSMTMAAAYGTIQNLSDEEISIVAVSSEMVDTVEIHTHKQDEAGVMRMRPMEKLIIPARSEIVLKPGADHFMLYGVHSEWIAGATGHFKLMTETGTTLSTDVMIVKATDFNPYK